MAKKRSPNTSIMLLDVADLVKKHSRENNVSQSKLIREAVRHYLTENDDKRIDFKTLKEFTTEFYGYRTELNRVGVLLNQIARKLNTYLEVDPEDLKHRQHDLMSLVRNMSLTLRKVEDAIKERFK